MINVRREASKTLNRKSMEKNQGYQKVFIFKEQQIGRSFNYIDQSPKRRGLLLNSGVKEGTLTKTILEK